MLAESGESTLGEVTPLCLHLESISLIKAHE